MLKNYADHEFPHAAAGASLGVAAPSFKPRRVYAGACETGQDGGLRLNQGTEMHRQVAVALDVVAMVAVIVGVDFLFFRNRFWERLTVNIGVVLVFAAFYFRFLRHS